MKLQEDKRTIKQEAHAYLESKGCRSIGQQYTAWEIEKMLVEFFNMQVKRESISNQ